MDLLKAIKQFIHRRRVGKACSFGSNTTIDSRAKFEGCNVLSNNSVFLNSNIGFASYIADNSFIKNTVIGRYCSIGNEVMTVAGSHPINEFISTHPAFYSKVKHSGCTFVKEDRYPEFKYLDLEKNISIEIGNDVWIGARVTILEGVKIADGAIIAAGALVTKDVPPYAVVGGVPAKIIKYRFELETINALIKLKWWDKDKAWLENHADQFGDIQKILENENAIH